MASDRHATGARTRLYGSGAAVTACLIGGAAVLYCDVSIAWYCGAMVVAGMAAVVGDALSGERPLRDAVERAAGTMASVVGFLVLPVVGWALGT